MDPFEIKPRMSGKKITQHFKDDREALRESADRRERLEAMAIMHTNEEVYVEISGSTAFADITSRDSKFGYTDRTIVTVRAEIPPQVSTNLDDEAWDWLVQKTDLYHEIGHVIYTDWPSFEDVLLGDSNGNYGVVGDHREMFKYWWNLIEDAAIERLLIERFNIQDELRIKNDNLLKNNQPDKTTSLNAATNMALVEYIHPIGWIDRLLDQNNDDFEFLTDSDREIFVDEIYPVIESLVPDIVDQPDPVKRNLMVFNLYQQIGVYFDQSVKPGEDEVHDFDLPKDAQKQSQQQGKGSKGKPPSGGSMPPVNPPSGSIKSVSQDVQRDYSQQVKQQKQQNKQPKKRASMEKWGRVIDHEYDDGTSMSLWIPGDPPSKGSYNDATRDEAEQMSQTLAKDLRQRLKKQRRSNKQKKKKSGKVDSSQVHKTGKGKSNIMSKHSKPDDKDYSCMLILDRSGSMSSEIVEAEKASGALAYALEEVGVSVGQLSLLKSDGTQRVQLEKDLADDVHDARKRMFRNCNRGGTPLSDALALARVRLQDEDNPFVIVVTDGEPDHRERYRDELAKCNFPVLGVYIKSGGAFDEDHMNEAGYFHQLEMRDSSDVFKGLKNLVRNVMF